MDFKEIKKEVDYVLKTVRNQARDEGTFIPGKEWQELEGQLKEKLLEKISEEEGGIKVEDYLIEEASISAYSDMEKAVDEAKFTLTATLREKFQDFILDAREHSSKAQKKWEISDKDSEEVLKEAREMMKDLPKKKNA